MPHRFVLMTDQPEAGYDRLIQPLPLWDDWRGLKNLVSWGENKQHCYVRLKAFSKEARAILGPRFVSIDLDCIVLKPLDPLFDRPEDFLIYRRPTQRTYYNGSMWLMTAGARAFIWEDFRGHESIVAAKRFTGTDQAWLCHRLGPNEKGWDIREGLYSWTNILKHGGYTERPPLAARIVSFHGGQKPWNFREMQAKKLAAKGLDASFLATSYRWIDRAWQ